MIIVTEFFVSIIGLLTILPTFQRNDRSFFIASLETFIELLRSDIYPIFSVREE